MIGIKEKQFRRLQLFPTTRENIKVQQVLRIVNSSELTGPAQWQSEQTGAFTKLASGNSL